MRVRLLIFTTIFITAFIGSILAEQMGEQESPCNGATTIFIINNDPAHNPSGTRPFAPTSVTTGCPRSWTSFTTPADFADTTEQMYFPAPIAYVSAIEEILEFYSDSTCVRYRYTPHYWHDEDPEPDTVRVPPPADENCCMYGIYVKTRMWDAETEKYSLWNDINVVSGIMIMDSPPNTYLMIDLKFKYIAPALTPPMQDMEFTCVDDTLFVYIWDCGDGDGAGTFGEFAALDTTFAVMPDMTPVDFYLTQYCPPVGIDEKPKLPKEYFLGQNSPNPFNAKTFIEYGLPEDAEVEIVITNLLGQKVTTLARGNESAGFKRVVWDGRDASGSNVPSGVYFYSIKANNFEAKKRAILMK